MTKLEKNLFHVDLALGDAQWELEGVEGLCDLKDCLQIAREYLAEARREIDEDKQRDPSGILTVRQSLN